jgi:hypothetical protein
MKYKNIRKVLLTFLLSAIAMYGCNTIAHFDQTAYNQIVSVEADALAIMDKATEDYSKHEQEVEDFSTRMMKAYLYDKNRPKNVISDKMWELMIDPESNLLGGFLKRWKSEKKLGKAFVSEAKKLVQENFDRIAQLESTKIKS